MDKNKNELAYGQRLYTVERDQEERLIIREYILNEFLMAGPICADEYRKSTPRPSVKRVTGFAEKEDGIKIRKEFTHTRIDPGRTTSDESDTAYTSRKAAEKALQRLRASASESGPARTGRNTDAQVRKRTARAGR